MNTPQSQRITNILLAIIAVTLIVMGIRQSNSVRISTTQPTPVTARYQLIRLNENNIAIFDQETGRMWQRFISSNSGPSDWETNSPMDSPQSQ